MFVIVTTNCLTVCTCVCHCNNQLSHRLPSIFVPFEAVKQLVAVSVKYVKLWLEEELWIEKLAIVIFWQFIIFQSLTLFFFIPGQQCNRLTRRVQSPRLQLGNLSPTGKFITYWKRLDSDFSSSAFPCLNNTFLNRVFRTQSSMQQSCYRFSSEELCFPLVTYYASCTNFDTFHFHFLLRVYC